MQTGTGQQQDASNSGPAASSNGDAGGVHIGLDSGKGQAAAAPAIDSLLPPSWHGPDLQLISQVPQVPGPLLPTPAVQSDIRLGGSSASQLQKHGSMDMQSLAALAAPCLPSRHSGAGTSRMFVRGSDDDDCSSVHSTGSMDVTHPPGVREQEAGLIAVGVDIPDSGCQAGISLHDGDADAVQSLYKPLPPDNNILSLNRLPNHSQMAPPAAVHDTRTPALVGAVQQPDGQQYRPATTLDPASAGFAAGPAAPGAPPAAMSVFEDRATGSLALGIHAAVRDASPAADLLLRHLRDLASRQASAHYCGVQDVLHASSASTELATAPPGSLLSTALPQEAPPSSRPRQPLTNLAVLSPSGQLCQSMPVPAPGPGARESQEPLHLRQLSASQRLGMVELRRAGSVPSQWTAVEAPSQLMPRASADDAPRTLAQVGDSQADQPMGLWNNSLVPGVPTLMDPISLPQLHNTATAGLGHPELHLSAIETSTQGLGNATGWYAGTATCAAARQHQVVRLNTHLLGSSNTAEPGAIHIQAQGSDTPHHLSDAQALEAALSTGGVVVPNIRTSMEISMAERSQPQTLNFNSSRGALELRGATSSPSAAFVRHGPATWPLGSAAGATPPPVPGPSPVQQQIVLPTLDLSQPSQANSQSQQDLQRVLAENLSLQLRHHMLMRQYRPVLQRTNIVMKIPWAEPTDIGTHAVDALFTEIGDRTGWQGVDARMRAGCIELQLTFVRGAPAVEHLGEAVRGTLHSAPAADPLESRPMPSTVAAAMQAPGTGMWNAAAVLGTVSAPGPTAEAAEGIAVSDILQGLHLTRLQPACATVQLQVGDTAQQLQVQGQQQGGSSWVVQPGPVLPPRPPTRIAHIEPAVLQCITSRGKVTNKPAVTGHVSNVVGPSATSSIVIDARIVCAQGTGWELRARCRGQAVPITYSITASRAVAHHHSTQGFEPAVQEVELGVSVQLDNSAASQAGLVILELWTRGGRLLAHWRPLIILPSEAPPGALEELRDAMAPFPAQPPLTQLAQPEAQQVEQQQQPEQAVCSAATEVTDDGLALDLATWLEYDAMRQASAAESHKTASTASPSRERQQASRSARKAGAGAVKGKGNGVSGLESGSQTSGKLPLPSACGSPEYQKLMRRAGISLASHFVLCGMRASADMVMQGLLRHEPVNWPGSESRAPTSTLHHPASHGAGLKRQLCCGSSSTPKPDALLSDLQKAGLLHNAVRSAKPDMVQLIASWGTLQWGAGGHSSDTPLQLASELFGEGSDMVTAVMSAMQNPTLLALSVQCSFAAPVSDAPHAVSGMYSERIRPSISAATCAAHYPLSQLGTTHLSDSVIPFIKDMAQRTADISGVHSEPYCRAVLDTSTNLRHVIGDMLSHRRQTTDDGLRGIVYVGGAMSTPTSYAAAHLLPSNTRTDAMLHSRGQHPRSGTAMAAEASRA